MFGFLYRNLARPILFLFDAECVHEKTLCFGEFLGRCFSTRKVFKKIFSKRYSELRQEFFSIEFSSPIGLAAGFDYQAKLTQFLSSLGFGFGTVGTITNQAYQGNPRPRLGRLPKSKSLMVNKGFKNPGVDKVIQKLKSLEFEIPIGISIGVTNSGEITTLEQGIQDIVSAFKKFSANGGEKSKLSHSYYELNISCPNLMVELDFYKPENLKQLLRELERSNLEKPVFVKMPISVSDDEALVMLKTISDFDFVKGVIFGNLQKNRQDERLNQKEVQKFPRGNFSGKPTEKRSNELIALAYKNYKNRFVIIGCGGIFNAQDVYKKIRLGASLVQLITGLVYQGPQLAAEINQGLVKLLKKDGFKHISEAIGVENRN
jgi:dihydroorotate dehydrogenase subfamily 2